MKPFLFPVFLSISFITLFEFQNAAAQTQPDKTVQLNMDEVHQTITGFGASLAYYESWLTAHPNRSEIYDVIFKELSLDILRIRNAHGYDAGMMSRIKEFAQAAEKSLGHPIDILTTSWGPPAYIKSNNDKNNGGTLKYSVVDGKVKFDYAGFASWWKESMDEYKSNGIIPTYIGIQNEPDWKASYESCLLRPSEVITSKDTIAGYNKALDAVYDTLMQLEYAPKFLSPECIGIGYNAVENYVNALDLSKLYGIGHHLYHGAESGTVEGDPFTSLNYSKVGKFHPEVPHFQTEYSRADWYSLAAMMFQSLEQESVTAFLYWDLIWSEGGLVNLHFPWDRSRWTNSKGYNRTKDFYVFKHYSAFIHPGWKRIGTSLKSEQIKTTAFISSTEDSATFIAINRSLTDSVKIRLQIPGYKINDAKAFTTTENIDFVISDYWADTLINLPPKSVNTIDLRLSKVNTGFENSQKINDRLFFEVSNSPNPFSAITKINFVSAENAEYLLEVFDMTGSKVYSQRMGYYPAGNHQITFDRTRLDRGIYIYQLKNSSGKIGNGRFIITD